MTAGAVSRAVPPCLVCRSHETLPFMSVGGRDYHRCPACQSTFLDPAQHPDAAAERAEYAMHENDPADPGYRRFLARLADPLLDRLAQGSTALDYGCGPGPALAAILREAGHAVALYDPFFHPDRAPLAHTYDAVTCTEVVEHFHNPAAEFDRLAGLVRPGGVLAVMTCFQTDDARFADWHYRRDPTHVVFYREETMHHIASARGWQCAVPARNVAFLTRPPAG